MKTAIFKILVLRGQIIIINLLFFLNKDKLKDEMIETILSWRAEATRAINEALKETS